MLFFIFTLSSTSVAAAYPEIFVIPGGESIGLCLETGIYVTGKYEVETTGGDCSPWKKGDIKVGDKILEVNNITVKKIEDVQNIMTELTVECDLLLKLKRKNEIINTTCGVVKTTNNRWSLGIYVKDHVLGIGTITYIHTETNTFGALGHFVIEEELRGNNIGYITHSAINGIRKSLPGMPGEKQATLNKEAIGNITNNTEVGIYGTLNKQNILNTLTKLKITAPNQVKVGPAEIWTVISDNTKERFSINIIEVKKQNYRGIKGIKIQITDEKLLQKTGGIIQGMSGSPIIQNNQLVGAVSHVLVDTPEYGYGVFAMWMIENNISQFGY